MISLTWRDGKVNAGESVRITDHGSADTVYYREVTVECGEMTVKCGENP